MLSWLFPKRPPAPAEQVWMHDAARWDAIVRRVHGADAVLIVVFFEATAATARERLEEAGIAFTEVGATPRSWEPTTRVHVARADRLRYLLGKLPEPLVVCGADQHPLPSMGRGLVEALAQRTPAVPTFHSSLDDPLLARFGGPRIGELLVKMGGTPEEPIEHPLVTRSLERARAKIGKKVRNQRDAASMEEWFVRNLGE